MTITIITKTKDGEISLPKEIRKSWKDVDVFVHASEDTIILKKVYQPSKLFNATTVRKLRSAGEKILDKDINKAEDIEEYVNPKRVKRSYRRALERFPISS